VPLNGIIFLSTQRLRRRSRISHLVGAAWSIATPAAIDRAQTIELTPAVYFPAYPGNSAPAVWPQNSPGSAAGIREIFGDDTFGDAADNRRVEPAG
jgi:hypothetical protein